LERKPVRDSFDQQPDRLGLIAGRKKWLVQAEWAARKRDNVLFGHQKFRSNAAPGGLRRIGYYCAFPSIFRTQEFK
jgi:hypothetical protein